MKLRESNVIFNEADHTYHLDGKRLSGVTSLIHSVLGLGVYPDANDFVRNFKLPEAASRGTAIHRAIETYDKFGRAEGVQTVLTRYGDGHEKELTWDVSRELANYIRHRRGFVPLANEHLVSDGVTYASAIDNIWQKEGSQPYEHIWLVDTKSNNLNYYPLCGYFFADYFPDSRSALQEYLSWQLSIYAELLEKANPGLKVEGLACNWLREGEAAFWIIERKESTLVWELLKSECVFADTGVVYYHPDPSIFGVGKRLAASTPRQVILQPDVVERVSALLTTIKEAEKAIETHREALRAAMQAYGVAKYDFGSFTASLAQDTVTESLDAKRLKEEHPEIYQLYVKKAPRKGALTIKLK